MNTDRLEAISFFSGCLGLDLGLELSGIEIKMACEIDPLCKETIKINKPSLQLFSDILNITVDEIRDAVCLKGNEKPFVVVGGPPCQAFSTAGKRKAFTDPRGNVFLRFLDLINELRPEYVVIENVRGLLSAALEHIPHNQRTSDNIVSKNNRPGTALDLVIRKLKTYGYGVSFNLYNAANFGVPQVRERVILLASRSGDVLPWLSPTHSNDESWGLPAWKTFRNAVDGLREEDMTGCKFPEKRLKYYRLLKEGQYWKDLPEHLWQEALGKSFTAGGGKTGFYRRVAWDKPSPTLVTHPAMPATDLAHPDKDRPLTIQEYKRIQQFPDSWIIAGNITEQYRQLGNAVPIGLGKAIGMALIAHREGKSIQKFSGFKYSRYHYTDHLEWGHKFFAPGENRLLSLMPTPCP